MKIWSVKVFSFPYCAGSIPRWIKYDLSFQNLTTEEQSSTFSNIGCIATCMNLIEKYDMNRENLIPDHSISLPGDLTLTLQASEDTNYPPFLLTWGGSSGYFLNFGRVFRSISTGRGKKRFLKEFL